MDVAIVYESLFGNTHEVAEAIADGMMDADASVALLPVGDAKLDEVAEADLLVVGGPTHVRGMTSASSRRRGRDVEQRAARAKDAVPGPEAGAGGPGVRDWFSVLPKAPAGSRAAAFDTRAGFKLAGGAARAIARRLRHRGYRLAAKPEGFIVEAAEGPLRDGERARARAWGAALVRECERPATR